jgi:hypothetical protein
MGWPGRGVLNNLAGGAGNAAIGSGRRLCLTVFNPQTMPWRRHPTMPVEQSDSQQVYLK